MKNIFICALVSCIIVNFSSYAGQAGVLPPPAPQYIPGTHTIVPGTAQLVIGRTVQSGPGPLLGHNPPLHAAVIQKDLGALRRLIENQGYSVNSVNLTNLTPLHLAAGRGYEEIVRYLLQHEANVNAVDNHGQTPLHAAAAAVREGVVKMLVGAGANIAAIDNNHETPADLAARTWLSQATAARVVDYLNNRAASSQMLLLGVRLNNLPLITNALRQHADLSIQDKNGNTPLHLAVLLRYPDIVRFLLQFTPPILIRIVRNNEGLSVIDCAVTVPEMLEIFRPLIL